MDHEGARKADALALDVREIKNKLQALDHEVQTTGRVHQEATEQLNSLLGQAHVRFQRDVEAVEKAARPHSSQIIRFAVENNPEVRNKYCLTVVGLLLLELAGLILKWVLGRTAFGTALAAEEVLCKRRMHFQQIEATQEAKAQHVIAMMRSQLAVKAVRSKRVQDVWHNR